MADSTNPLQQIVAGSGADARVNENFDAASPAMIFGRDSRTATGLTWGYIGGRWCGLSIASGTLALTASATNYVVTKLSDGTVSVSTSTTNWNDTANYARSYKIVAGSATVSSYEDHRAGTNGTLNAAAVSGGAGGITLTSKSADYTAVLADANTGLLHPSADTTARTFTVPSNAAVAYNPGTTLTFVNQSGAGSLSIAINVDTMRLAGTGSTGTRTLAANGIATALKLTATEWLITGTALT